MSELRMRSNLIETGKYVINTTNEHMELYNIIMHNNRGIEYNKQGFLEAIDSIMTAAHKMKSGNVNEDVMGKLVEDFIFDIFGTMADQAIIEHSYDVIMKILNYYVITLLDLRIDSNLIFVDGANRNGVYLTTYNAPTMDISQA